MTGIKVLMSVIRIHSRTCASREYVMSIVSAWYKRFHWWSSIAGATITDQSERNQRTFVCPSGVLRYH